MLLKRPPGVRADNRIAPDKGEIHREGGTDMSDHPIDQHSEEEIRRAAAEMERNAALNVALNEAVKRDDAEADAVDARIAANQNAQAARELASERNHLQDRLAAEQQVSSSNAFGFYLMTGILVAIALVAAIYFYVQRQNIAAGTSGNVVVSSNSAPPPPVTNVAQPPAIRTTVPPPQANIDVNVAQPSAPNKDTSHENAAPSTQPDQGDTSTGTRPSEPDSGRGGTDR
jgi:hypothetical protein